MSDQQWHPDAGNPVWDDQQALSSGWDPPAWHDRFRLRTKVAALVLALALVVGVLYAVGGFRPEATVTEVDWRTPVVSGPVEITVLRAVYEDTEYSDPEIKIEMLCRLAVDSATRVQVSDARRGIGLDFDAQTIPYNDRYMSFGPDESGALPRWELAPGVGPTPCYLKGDLPEGQQPAPFVRVLVFNQKYAQRGFAAGTEKQWTVVRGGHALTVPVEILPNP